MNKLKILSCFDGISACQVALKNLGIEYDYFAAEIDPYAIKVTQANFPNTVQLGDVKSVFFDNYDEDVGVVVNKKESRVEKQGIFDVIKHYNYEWLAVEGIIDLLVGGSPCQSFSIAGSQKGFEDPRGQLFWEYVRILNEVKPKFFIFENVASMSKENQNIISEELGVQPIMINSDIFVQQNRKRLYWTNIPVDNLPKRPDWQGDFYQWRRNHFRKNKSGVCPTLTANMGTGGHNVPLKSENKDDKLTVNECCRLQGFPDFFVDSISKSQGYKALGNSFTVPVIEHILKTILK
jgi:DNA (cytosine-5)-methyltransferase 3A